MVGLEKSSGANGAGGATGLAVPIPLGARSALRANVQVMIPGLKL